eukprot:Em0007g1164a
MAGRVGKIGEFDAALEEWGNYMERVTHYFAANGIEADKQKDTFLCCIDRDTFGLLRTLVAPAKPGEKTYKELVDALTAHLAPKPLVIAERFRFHKRVQKEGESIKVYAASLQKLAEHCAFGQSLADTLRDRLVCGMRNEKVQQRLLTMGDLTFRKAVEEAEMAERASKDVVEFHESVHEVHRLPAHAGGRCYRCDGQHDPQTCRFLNEQCNFCKKRGHVERACMSKKRFSRGSSTRREQKAPPRMVKTVERPVGSMDELESGDETLNWGGVYTMAQWKDGKPMYVEVMIEGQQVKMELDTGAAVSLLPYQVYQENFAHLPLDKTQVRLKTYTGEHVLPRGLIKVEVRKGTESARLPLLVVNGTGPPLFGRNWLAKIPIDWSYIKSLTCSTTVTLRQQRLEQLIAKYPGLGQDSVGKMADVKAHLTLKDGAVPVFMKARPVPYSLRAKVETELARLEREGILTQVTWSDWATPVVVVPKTDGSVRLCGDFKVTVNPALNIDRYPLPRIEDILATLGGSTVFSKIDLQLAYLQMELDDASKELTTIHTHKGLFRYNRLAFGIASAPAIWQRAIERVLEGIPKTQCLLDDIIVAGAGEEEHLQLLEQVLERLNRYHLTINKRKCVFFQKEVSYCGYRVDGEGLHKTAEKVKQLMSSDTVLTHFNPRYPLVLACDASAYGLGAVLSHTMPDGGERPVAYASRTLSPAECNYAQIDKEALAIVWAVKKFHQYLYGLNFTLITDHQPLTALFSPDRNISATAASRLQRQALFLSAYTYTMRYRSTTQHANADALSRLPSKQQDQAPEDSDDSTAYLVQQLELLPVTALSLKAGTLKDPELTRVMTFAQSGWPRSISEDLKPFFVRRDELTIEQGCLMWGARAVIPQKYRSKVLDELHGGHLGVVKMKALARAHVWWPNIDRDIEGACQSCTGCQLMKQDPKLTPVHPWEYPEGPWQRVHLDFAGPFEGKTFLIMVDAYTKWPEVSVMTSTTTEVTIDELRTTFARWGIPQQIVTDNGQQFVSEMFQRFMSHNNIKHIKSSPYHPATNGLAERFVQTLKQALRDERSLQHRLASFLLSYRNSRHATTETAPSYLMMGRELRCRLHLLKPDLRGTVSKAMTRQVMTRAAAIERSFGEGERVMVHDYRTGHTRWQPATITQKLGVKSYLVDVGNGGVWKRHADQIRSADERSTREESEVVDCPVPQSRGIEPVLQPPMEMVIPPPKTSEGQGMRGLEGAAPQEAPLPQETQEAPLPHETQEETPLSQERLQPQEATQLQVPRRSGRAIKKPARYTDGGT